MKRSEERILTTHVGSLIRPRAVLDAAKDRDPAHREARERELSQAVADVVARQAKAGIDVVNDGEFGKSGWANYSLERLTGFEPRPDTLYPAVWLGRDRFRFAEFMAAEFPRGTVGTPGHACCAPITYRGQASVRRDLANLKAAAEAAKPADLFFTAVAPASVGYDAANEH
jgi:5-methyltetrahydropteroyltriglutamate--homocysteine methyltransferase